MRTPYEKFKSLENAERHLAPGLAFAALDAVARTVSDLQAAEALNRARTELFRRIEELNAAAA